MEEASLITREVRHSRSIHDLPDEYKTLVRYGGLHEQNSQKSNDV